MSDYVVVDRTRPTQSARSFTDYVRQFLLDSSSPSHYQSCQNLAAVNAASRVERDLDTCSEYIPSDDSQEHDHFSDPDEHESPSFKCTGKVSQYLVSAQDGTAPTLLFRCFDERSSGKNEATDICAARQMCTVPAFKQFLEISATHLDEGRKKATTRTSSPFVSTTSSMIWAFEKSLGKSNEAQIAIFRPHLIDNPIFSVRPIVARLKQTGDANFNYKGACEYFLWQGARPVNCFYVRDVLQLCKSFTSVDEFLSPTILKKPSPMWYKWPLLKSRKLDDDLRIVVAKVLHCIGASYMGRAMTMDLATIILQDWRVASRVKNIQEFLGETWNLLADGYLTDPYQQCQPFLDVLIPESIRGNQELLKSEETPFASDHEMIESQYMTGLLTPDQTPRKKRSFFQEVSRSMTQINVVKDMKPAMVEQLDISNRLELWDDCVDVKAVYVNVESVSKMRSASQSVNALAPKFLFSPYTPQLY